LRRTARSAESVAPTPGLCLPEPLTACAWLKTGGAVPSGWLAFKFCINLASWTGSHALGLSSTEYIFWVNSWRRASRKWTASTLAQIYSIWDYLSMSFPRTPWPRVLQKVGDKPPLCREKMTRDYF
jgi:hypothetical protein